METSTGFIGRSVVPRKQTINIYTNLQISQKYLNGTRGSTSIKPPYFLPTQSKRLILPVSSTITVNSLYQEEMMANLLNFKRKRTSGERPSHLFNLYFYSILFSISQYSLSPPGSNSNHLPPYSPPTPPFPQYKFQQQHDINLSLVTHLSPNVPSQLNPPRSTIHINPVNNLLTPTP